MYNIKKIFLSVLVIILFFVMAVPAFAVTIENPSTDYFLDFSGGGGNTFENVILFFINALLGIVGIISVAMLIYGGFQYITSQTSTSGAGTSAKTVEEAKKTIKNALFGLIIVVLAYVIVVVVLNALAGDVGGGIQ